MPEPAKNQNIATSSLTEEEKSASMLKEIWHGFKKNRLAVIGAGIVFLFIVLGVLAAFIAPEGINNQKDTDRLLPPSTEYWLGTDDFGRDILSRILHGAKLSLTVGFFAVAGSAIVGTFLGIIAGYYGRWLDSIISRVFDILLAFPSILLAIAIVAILGPSLQNALIAIAIINVPTFGRIVRSKVLGLKQEEYIQAATSVGMRDRRILVYHILPNSLAPIIVQGTLCVATAILEAAALGFLGLGAQAPQPEWGRMLSDSQTYLQQAPWTVFFPGIAIMLTVLGFNLMGDGLRDALDPKMKE
ncbi:ABC transporter permease [Salibacterium salarium]